MHEFDRFADQAQINGNIVDETFLLQQHQPCICPYKKACPERDQHANHADIGPFPGYLRHEIGQRVAQQGTENGRQYADFECRDKNADIGLGVQHPFVVFERE